MANVELCDCRHMSIDDDDDELDKAVEQLPTEE
jgi:hypothetical protein